MTIKVKAGTLRRAAAAADGHRGRDVHLLLSADHFDIVDALPDPLPPDRIVITCNTQDHEVPGRAVIEKLEATATKDGTTMKDELQSKYDAVFWRETAIEKFVQPYYAGFYGVDAPGKLDALQRSWRDPRVWAVAHLPKSDPTVLGDLAASGKGARISENFHVLTVGTGEQMAFLPEKFVSEILDQE
jgi:hypothetical protein